jgi:hypothetical protein
MRNNSNVNKINVRSTYQDLKLRSLKYAAHKGAAFINAVSANTL